MNYEGTVAPPIQKKGARLFGIMPRLERDAPPKWGRVDRDGKCPDKYPLPEKDNRAVRFKGLGRKWHRYLSHTVKMMMREKLFLTAFLDLWNIRHIIIPGKASNRLMQILYEKPSMILILYLFYFQKEWKNHRLEFGLAMRLVLLSH